jgi:hypothetical protein
VFEPFRVVFKKIFNLFYLFSAVLWLSSLRFLRKIRLFLCTRSISPSFLSLDYMCLCASKCTFRVIVVEPFRVVFKKIFNLFSLFSAVLWLSSLRFLRKIRSLDQLLHLFFPFCLYFYLYLYILYLSVFDQLLI